MLMIKALGGPHLQERGWNKDKKRKTLLLEVIIQRIVPQFVILPLITHSQNTTTPFQNE